MPAQERPRLPARPALARQQPAPGARPSMQPPQRAPRRALPLPASRYSSAPWHSEPPPAPRPRQRARLPSAGHRPAPAAHWPEPCVLCARQRGASLPASTRPAHRSSVRIVSTLQYPFLLGPWVSCEIRRRCCSPRACLLPQPRTHCSRNGIEDCPEFESPPGLRNCCGMADR